MSKTKHSSGRWLLIKAGAGSIVIAEDASPVPGLRFPKTVARTDWCRGEEDDANAHLITAAPDLLEALEYLAGRFDGIDNGQCRLCGAVRKYVASAKNRTQPCENRTCKSHLIVSAIAKAEGRS